MDEAATEESLKLDNLLRILNDRLQASYQRGSKNLTSITFQRIIEQFQDEAGGAKSELPYLLCIEDKLSDLLDFSKEDYRRYLTVFSQALTNKVAKLKKRQQKAEPTNFQRIVGRDFKKKIKNTPFLTAENQAEAICRSRNSKLASKSPRRSDNSQNKLKRLFSKEKKPVKERQKGSFARNVANQQGQTQSATCQGESRDQSVSFSTILAASVTVKARKRKSSNDFKMLMPKKIDNDNDEKQQGEEAFIFYRLKKGKNDQFISPQWIYPRLTYLLYQIYRSISIMNSLRTDDILGAKPRVRHMPKDLIRQRRIPQTYFPSIEPSNPEWGYHAEQYPNYPKNQHYGRVDYQNNDPTGIPFIPQTRLTKESRYVNYDFTQQTNNGYQGRYPQGKMSPPQLMRAASEQRNLPERKQSPKQYAPRPTQHKNSLINQSMEARVVKDRGQDQLQKTTQRRSRKSMQSRDQQYMNESKNIFRGLGFNIITNRKYQYEFEHHKPTVL